MNVRFSEGEMRFRVSTQEFETLVEGKAVQLETVPLTFVVQMAKKVLEPGMVIDLSCGAVQLVISPEEVKQLQARLPSRQGIEKRLSLGREKSLDVAFEIDIKAQSKSAGKV